MKNSESNLKDIFEFYFNKKITFDTFSNISLNNNHKRVRINKKDIYIPSKELKLILSFISNIILKKLPIEEDVVFSYRKDVNTKDCLTPHIKSNFFYTTDIVNFFPSISRNVIKRNLYKDIYDISYLNKNDLEKYFNRILEFITINDKLPIGFPTSPYISNYIMRDNDLKIKEFCSKNNLTYTRYADDIIISSVEDINKSYITDKIKKIFEEDENHFELNIAKTKVLTRKHKITILGLTINSENKITVDNSVKNDIEIGIFLLSRDKIKFANYFKTNETSAKRILAGKISYATHIEPEYLHKIVKKYGLSIINDILKVIKWNYL